MIVYKRAELLALCSYDVTPARFVRKAIFNNHLWLPGRLRLQRANNRTSQLLSSVNPVLPLVSDVTGNSTSVRTFCLLNVRSLSDKVDDVIELCRDNSVDVACLVESWHDSDDVPVRRLRAMGYSVVDRPRPRQRDDMATNHGGILVLSSASVRMSVLPFDSPSSFELLCVRATSGNSSEILVVVYRPGSQAVQQHFFDDLSAVLERAATYSAPVHVVGDFNIRLDRPDDPNAHQFRSLLSGCGFTIAITGPTHNRGGTLDVVASTAAVDVTVIDAGISDHHALRWRTMGTTTSPLPLVDVVPAFIRPWHRLDMEAFRTAVSASRLCRPDSWPEDVDGLCALYSSELTTILDGLLPLCVPSRKQRPSDPWFDSDCREAKRATRRLERAYAAASRRCCQTVDLSATALGRNVAAAAAAKAAWYAHRRAYRQLRRRKCHDFWRQQVENSRSCPRQLWQTVDKILGRCKPQPCDNIDVEQFSQFSRKGCSCSSIYRQLAAPDVH